MGRNSFRRLWENCSVLSSVLLLIVSTAADDNESYRLPTNVWPISYDIKLAPNYPSEAIWEVENFKGTVDIIAEVKENTDIILLHNGNDIEVDPNKVIISVLDGVANYENENNNLYNYTMYNSKTEIRSFSLKEIITKDQRIKISIEFTGKLSSDMYGFYKSTYTIKDGNGDDETKILLTTQFESTHARKAFPCFDEPKFKAKFTVTLDVPEGYGALCNTAMDEATSTDTHIVFKETVVMSTYLLAFIVYEKATFGSSIVVLGTDNVRFTTWGRVAAIRKHQADYSQTITHRLLTELDDFTGIKYSADGVIMKVDQAAIPDFAAGAMENWGLVTYRETGLLFDEVNNTESSRKSVANVIAHELTHQWFGNLVTLDWWSYTWLNEGFARFFQYFLLNDVYPKWRMMEQLVVDQQMTIFASDALLSAVPLTRDVNTQTEIDGTFSTSSYSKGAAVVRLLSIILGPEHFKKGLQKYLEDRKYKTSEPQHLFGILNETKPDNLDLPEGFDFTELITWTNEAGFPLITFKRDSMNSKITISQERFLLEETNDPPDTIYPVYLEWSTSNGDHTKRWLVEKEISSSEGLPATDDDWFIVNNTGYFRVDYDIQNWRNIFIQLTQNHTEMIAPLDRATLVDNALNLARIDRFQYICALSFMLYLEHETDYIPWTAAFSGLSFLHRMLNQVDETGIFNEFVQRLTEKVYDFLGYQDRGDHLEKLHRANTLSWACRVGHENCRSVAVDLLTTYLDEERRVPANLRSVTYCYGIKSGPDDLWWKLWQKLQENDDVSERSLLISALGCTKSYSTLYMYLEQSLLSDGVIRQQDAVSVFSAVYTNPEGIDVALDFLIENFDRIEKTYTSMNAIRNVVTGIANYLTTMDQKSKMEKLVEEKDSLKNIGNAALKTIETNLKWLEKYQDSVLTTIYNLTTISQDELSFVSKSDVLC